jgi:hypothetical protein
MEAGLSPGSFSVRFVRSVVPFPACRGSTCPGGDRRDGPLRVLRVFVVNLALAWQESVFSTAGIRPMML